MFDKEMNVIELFEAVGSDKIISGKELEEMRAKIDAEGLRDEFKNVAVAPLSLDQFDGMSDQEVDAMIAIVNTGSFLANGLSFSQIQKYGTEYCTGNAAVIGLVCLAMMAKEGGKVEAADEVFAKLNDPQNVREFLQAYTDAKDFSPELKAGKLKLEM